tara:strand:+ start:1100 stop:1300 length:201 start_codon:yes stop_codon:yes gene_type:complete
MKNKLTATLNIKQRRVLALVNIMEEMISILKTMDHPEYNVLMRDTDTEELLRLAKQGKKLLKELQK